MIGANVRRALSSSEALRDDEHLGDAKRSRLSVDIIPIEYSLMPLGTEAVQAIYGILKSIVAIVDPKSSIPSVPFRM
jgi:hypothetical protein